MPEEKNHWSEEDQTDMIAELITQLDTSPSAEETHGILKRAEDTIRERLEAGDIEAAEALAETILLHVEPAYNTLGPEFRRLTEIIYGLSDSPAPVLVEAISRWQRQTGEPKPGLH